MALSATSQTPAGRGGGGDMGLDGTPPRCRGRLFSSPPPPPQRAGLYSGDAPPPPPNATGGGGRGATLSADRGRALWRTPTPPALWHGGPRGLCTREGAAGGGGWLRRCSLLLRQGTWGGRVRHDTPPPRALPRPRPADVMMCPPQRWEEGLREGKGAHGHAAGPGGGTTEGAWAAQHRWTTPTTPGTTPGTPTTRAPLPRQHHHKRDTGAAVRTQRPDTARGGGGGNG